MLASFVLHLEPEKVTPISSIETPLTGEGRGVQARGVFYDVLRRSAPELSDRLHADGGRAPFTAACLPSIRRQREVRLRFTTLTREVFNALSDSLLHHFAAGERLQIGRETFRLTRIVLDGVDDQLVGMSDYSRLFSLAPTRRFAFRFLTPTTFRVGDANLPLPVPQSVFRGLWQKWNAFAPPDLHMTHEVLTAAGKYVLPNAFRLRTGVHEMREGKMIGFLGDCSFELLGKVEEATMRAIAALSRFAFFAGVGAKTTMGLGQTVTDWAR